MNSNLNYEKFMKLLGNYIIKFVILVIAFITYASRRNFILEEYLSNDFYKLGLIEGIGLTLVVFGQISKSSKLIFNIFNAIVSKINQSNNSNARARAADVVVEPPADVVVELPADVDEIDLPEPSFPSDRWEFLWFRYTEDKRNPWGDFIAQTSKTELNFDEDWGKGIVNNSGLSNNVGFIASRTIRLNDAGRYTFLIGGDDGIRLYVYNDNLTETFLGINEWNDQPYSQFERTITLPAGEYKLLLEWYEHYDNARVSFKLRECETDDEVRASRGLPPHARQLVT